MSRGWCAEKIRKVKMYDAQIARRQADSEVWWDHVEGRKIFPMTASSEEEYDAFQEAHPFTSHDKWAVTVMTKAGVHVNIAPKQRKKHVGLRFPVYFDNGCRVLFDDVDAALERLCCDEHAVKMWDGTTKTYLTK